MNKIIVVRNADEQIQNELTAMLPIIVSGSDVFIPYEFITDEMFTNNFEFDVIDY